MASLNRVNSARNGSRAGPLSVVPLTLPLCGSKLVFLLEERIAGEKIAASLSWTTKGRSGKKRTPPCSNAAAADAASLAVSAAHVRRSNVTILLKDLAQRPCKRHC